MPLRVRGLLAALPLLCLGVQAVPHVHCMPAFAPGAVPAWKIDLRDTNKCALKDVEAEVGDGRWAAVPALGMSLRGLNCRMEVRSRVGLGVSSFSSIGSACIKERFASGPLMMSIKVQNERKSEQKLFQRWWDPDWRVMRLAELKVCASNTKAQRHNIFMHALVFADAGVVPFSC